MEWIQIPESLRSKEIREWVCFEPKNLFGVKNWRSSRARELLWSQKVETQSILAPTLESRGGVRVIFRGNSGVRMESKFNFAWLRASETIIIKDLEVLQFKIWNDYNLSTKSHSPVATSVRSNRLNYSQIKTWSQNRLRECSIKTNLLRFKKQFYLSTLNTMSEPVFAF